MGKNYKLVNYIKDLWGKTAIVLFYLNSNCLFTAIGSFVTNIELQYARCTTLVVNTNFYISIYRYVFRRLPFATLLVLRA